MERKSVVESLPLMIIGSKYRINSFFHSKILTFFVTIYSFEIFSLLSSLFLSIQIAETLLIAVGGCTWQRGKHIPKKYFLSFVSQTQVCRAGEGVAGRSWAEANVFQNFKEKEFFQTKKRFHERRRVTREVTALNVQGWGILHGCSLIDSKARKGTLTGGQGLCYTLLRFLFPSHHSETAGERES